MASILVIDCGSSKAPNIAECVRDFGFDAALIRLTDFTSKSSNGHQGIIISGAPILVTEVDPEPYKTILQPVIACDIPVLGICFGHQIIGMLFGASAEKCTPARSTQEVEILAADSLFNGLSDKPIFREDHCEAISVPDNFIHLATSSICTNEAMRHPQKALWGVQFHPEVDTEDGRTLLRNFTNNCVGS